MSDPFADQKSPHRKSNHTDPNDLDLSPMHISPPRAYPRDSPSNPFSDYNMQSPSRNSGSPGSSTGSVLFPFIHVDPFQRPVTPRSGLPAQHAGEEDLNIADSPSAPRFFRNIVRAGTHGTSERDLGSFSTGGTRAAPALHPYHVLNEYHGMTVWELLHVVLPDAPPYYREPDGPDKPPLVLKSTKALREAVLRTPSDRRLRKIVYANDMLEPVLIALQPILSRFVIDWSNKKHRAWVWAVHPYYTRQHLPKKIHSEKDIEAWIYGILLRPSVVVGLTIEAGSIPGNQHVEFPFLSSAVQKSQAGDIIPDIILVASGEHPNEEIVLRTEAKSRNVIYQWQGGSNEHLFSDLQREAADYPVGHAIKFEWPGTLRKQTTLTKVLVQIWEQIMEDRKEEVYNILSCYDVGTFAARRGDTLYLSRNCGVRDKLLLMTCCMVAHSLGVITSKLDLPEPDTSKWSKNIRDDKVSCPPGVDVTKVAVRGLQVTARRLRVLNFVFLSRWIDYEFCSLPLAMHISRIVAVLPESRLTEYNYERRNHDEASPIRNFDIPDDTIGVP
ncbi:hypothetical protein NM688_g5414 [Phlebia brevispora]|uniref:Uncharacterized protein n=1 Tax=Phlebia brevispora TaxID=194682 RepID=A0ACC1SVQ8_9APHY|nr:hypothetical protein NM688_g5414 [Phlebia brevispora]